MKMPRVVKAEADAEYQHLLTMFDATTQFSERPAWTFGKHILHVDCLGKSRPKKAHLEPRLRALIGAAQQKNRQITRVCYGVAFMEGDKDIYSIFVETRTLEEPEAA